MVAVWIVFYSRFQWECHGNLLVYMMMSVPLCVFVEVILKSHLLPNILIVLFPAKTKCCVFVFSSIFASVFEDDSVIFLSWHVAIVSPNDWSLHLKSWHIILLARCQNVSADILFNVFALLFISKSYSVMHHLRQVWISKLSQLCKEKSGLFLNNGAI